MLCLVKDMFYTKDVRININISNSFLLLLILDVQVIAIWSVKHSEARNDLVLSAKDNLEMNSIAEVREMSPCVFLIVFTKTPFYHGIRETLDTTPRKFGQFQRLK